MIGSGLDHQQVRMVGWSLHVYEVDFRLYSAPLCQGGQNMWWSIANHVTLALRLGMHSLWWPL